MDIWSKIKENRELLADYLDSMADEDWEKQSLCSEWNVKEVAEHMLVIPTQAKGKVFLSFLKSGFNLDKMNARYVAQFNEELTAADICKKTRESAGSQITPPGVNEKIAYGELLVHSLDISEAVGKPLNMKVDHLTDGLDYFKNEKSVIGCKERIEGLKLKTNDADWEHGEGPIVEGSAKDLLLAMTGRKSALDSLSGDGVELLKARS